MFGKSKVSQSLIDAVNSVMETKVDNGVNTGVQQLDEAGWEKVQTSSGTKVYGSSYGDSKKARKDQTKSAVDTVKEPKKKDLEEDKDDCVTKPQAKGIAKKEVEKHEKGMHGEKGEVSKHEKKMHKESFKDRLLEREMTGAESRKKERIVLAMKDKQDYFKKKYGKRWKDVMYATATKQAMGEELVHGEEVEGLTEGLRSFVAGKLAKASGMTPHEVAKSAIESINKRVGGTKLENHPNLSNFKREVHDHISSAKTGEEAMHRLNDTKHIESIGKKHFTEEVELDEDIHDTIKRHLEAGHKVLSKAAGRVGPITGTQKGRVIFKAKNGHAVTSFSSGDKVKLVKHSDTEYHVVNEDTIDEATPPKGTDVADKSYLKTAGKKPGPLHNVGKGFKAFLQGKPEPKESVELDGEVMDESKVDTKHKTVDMLRGRVRVPASYSDDREHKSSKVKLAQEEVEEKENYGTTKQEDTPARKSIKAHDGLPEKVDNLDPKYGKPGPVKEAKTAPQDDVPFEPPYSKTQNTVTDKSGAKHTPMSRAKDLARHAMKRLKKENMLGKAPGNN